MNKTNFKLFTMFLAGIAFSAMTVLAATISISTNFEDGVTQYLKKLVILKNDNTTGMVLDGDTLSGENIYGTNISGNNIHGSSIHSNTLSGINIYGTNISGNNIHGSNIYGNTLSGNNIKGTNITGTNVYGTNISGNIIHGSSIYGNTLSGNNIKSANITGTNIYGTNISGNNITGTNIKGNKISGQSGLFSQYCDENGQSCKTIAQLITPDQLWNKNGNSKIYYNNGCVGIGEHNPSEKLEVNGTGKFSGNITAKNGYFSGVQFSNSGTINFTDSLKFLRGSSTDIFISGGNVGIGTDEPQAKLHVNGGLMLGDAESCSTGNRGTLSLQTVNMGLYNKRLVVCRRITVEGETYFDRVHILLDLP